MLPSFRHEVASNSRQRNRARPVPLKTSASPSRFLPGGRTVRRCAIECWALLRISRMRRFNRRRRRRLRFCPWPWWCWPLSGLWCLRDALVAHLRGRSLHAWWRNPLRSRLRSSRCFVRSGFGRLRFGGGCALAACFRCRFARRRFFSRRPLARCGRCGRLRFFSAALTLAAGGWLRAGVVALRALRFLPDLARGGRLFARPPRFALRLLETLARALQLFLGYAYALLCYIRLESGPFRGLCRCGFSIIRFFGRNFAACLLHPRACEVSEGAQVSHKRRTVSTTVAALPVGLPPRLIHRICA